MSIDADVALCVKEDVWLMAISFRLGANETVKFEAPFDMTVRYISFHNINDGTAFTSAASVKNGADTVDSSSADLAADGTEVKESTDLGNTDITDGTDVHFIAGDQPTAIVIWVHYTFT